MSDLVYRTCSSPQTFGQVQIGVFSIFGFHVKFLINRNYHNSRISDDIDVKLGLLSKIKLESSVVASKSLTVTSCR